MTSIILHYIKQFFTPTGIGIEGIGCVLAGAFGSGSGTTSYSENIGAIGITKVLQKGYLVYFLHIQLLVYLCMHLKCF